MTGLEGLLGLGARAGSILIGVEAVRAGLQRERCRAVVIASDASPRAREKVERLAVGRGIPRVVGPGSDALGRRLGRPPVMVVGIVDPALARGIVRAAPGGPA